VLEYIFQLEPLDQEEVMALNKEHAKKYATAMRNRRYDALIKLEADVEYDVEVQFESLMQAECNETITDILDNTPGSPCDLANLLLWTHNKNYYWSDRLSLGIEHFFGEILVNSSKNISIRELARGIDRFAIHHFQEQGFNFDAPE
jgi:hypothetical protein